MLCTHCVCFDSFHHREMVKSKKKDRGSREPFIVSVLAIISFFALSCCLIHPGIYIVLSSRIVQSVHCLRARAHTRTLHHGYHWKWRTYRGNIISFVFSTSIVTGRPNVCVCTLFSLPFVCWSEFIYFICSKTFSIHFSALHSISLSIDIYFSCLIFAHITLPCITV